jgi:glycosyltransferase involved in cell wall biosynthesis
MDMPTQPIVSVIMIFLNAKPFIREAIESVLAQTYEHWELLLVDDGSNDGSEELARQYAAQYPSRIYYLEHEGHINRGMSASRNLGIRNASGEYLAFLDADDYWLPERLATHVGMLAASPSIGMLYGTAKYWFSWTGDPRDCDKDFVPKLRTRRAVRFDPPELLTLMLAGKAEVPCTCSILVRREVVQKIGGFEESFKGMYEDQAFYAKICLATPVLATGDCLAWYRQHPNSHSAVVVESGKLWTTEYVFLRWLEEYCFVREVQDPVLLQTIRRRLWLNSHAPSGCSSILPPRILHWLKKWVLRLEERILPSRARNWFFRHR